MPSVQYGEETIQYSIEEKENLHSHYISVAKDTGVILKGKPVLPAQADGLILKKARWILQKLELVKDVPEDKIVTGSRIPYLGRKYYTEVLFDPAAEKAQVLFNHSQFTIKVNPSGDTQAAMREALDQFMRAKAVEKIAPRVKKLSKQTGLVYNELKFFRMEKRWASCTGTNNIIINPEVVKLPFSLIDYVIVHELCHTKVKNHSKEFWAELSRHLVNWKELDMCILGWQF